MTQDKKIDKKAPTDKEVEDIFEKVYENWSSRRRCEHTHAPEFIKKKKETD